MIVWVTRRLSSRVPPAASLPPPHKRTLVLSLISSHIMSEKLKEFIDIPQQFVRDGNQVCSCLQPLENVPQMMPLQFLTRCTKPSQKGLSNSDVQSHFILTSLPRVYPNFQGSRHWFCGHGFHRLLRQVDPHPDVSLSCKSLQCAANHRCAATIF